VSIPFKRTHSKLPAAAALALTMAGAPAQADTLVNIKGYGSDGAGANIYSYPVAPGTLVDLFNPVLVSLAAGSYALTSAWGAPGALYDTWNFQTTVLGSWVSHYVAAEVLPDGQYRLLVDGVSLLEPTCANHFCAWSTRAQASAAFLATPAYTFTLTQTATVAFVSADYYLPDNDGGISLWVTAAPVPEPAGWALALAGCATVLGTGALRRRRSPEAICRGDSE
jgi:hypothetical protein